MTIRRMMICRMMICRMMIFASLRFTLNSLILVLRWVRGYFYVEKEKRVFRRRTDFEDV